MASGKVLILDDNHATRTQLREFLPKGQYEIKEATDGEWGLSLIHQERSNIRFIILDSALPKVNGWDVLERLQADVELQRIPLVMMTELNNAPISSHPMVEFLQKPFERKELRTVVKNAIGKAISVYQDILRDREEVSLSSQGDFEPTAEPTAEPVIEPTVDLDNIFETFVESERKEPDPSASYPEWASAIEPEQSEERELDFSFDTTGTEEAIDKDEMAALGLNFPALDTVIVPEENSVESQEEKSEFRPIAKTKETIEIDIITPFNNSDRNDDVQEKDFSFDTTSTDETIDTSELNALQQEETPLQESEKEDIEVLDTSSLSLEELNKNHESFDFYSDSISAVIDEETAEIDEFPSLDIDLSSEDLTPEIDEFPSLDIDLSSEDLTPEIDEFPSLDIDLSSEDLTPEIDEFPSLDINLSSEDLTPEIDEFPSLDINISSEDFDSEIDGLDLVEHELKSTDKKEENLSQEDVIQNNNDVSPLELEYTSEESNVLLDESFGDLGTDESLATSEETNENSFELKYTSEESNALLDESFGDLGTDESLATSEETEENSFELEYTSEESNALLDESFGDLGTDESLAISEETEENDFELKYTSEESNALLDESFGDLGTDESLAISKETEENSFELEYASEESNALLDESFGDLETNESLEINKEISDRLAPMDYITEDGENTFTSETSEFNVDIFDTDRSDELNVFSDELPVESSIEFDINTSDEDVQEDYMNRTEDREENLFDPSLTLNPAGESQVSSDDIFSVPNPSESVSEKSPQSSDDPFSLSWEEQTSTVTNQNESDSIFDPSLPLDEETVAYPSDINTIFPPLDTDDLFEPETTENEPFVRDSASNDSIIIENFDRQFPQGDRPSEEQEYTIFEDRRNTPISLPSVLPDSDSDDPEVEHTILEDKRSRQTSESLTESEENNASSEPESEFTIIEDKKSVNDLSSQSFKIEPFTAEESDRQSSPNLKLPEDEQTIQLNKTFIEEDRRGSEISHLVNLSGFDDVLMRYQSTVEEVKISALKEAFDYDEPGYHLIINALREDSSEIRQVAEQLLIEQLKSPKIQVLPPHKNWASMECLQTLRGHSYWVQDVAIAPDNRTIASASKDGTIKLWDILTGREIRTLHGHESAVLSVAISADGERIISCSTDNTIKTWSLETGMELNNMLGKSHKIYVLAVSPDGKTVISASADNTIKPKYDGGLEAFLNRIPSRRVSAILSLIGLLKRSPAIKIWDLDKGRPKGNFRGYSRGVTDLAISPKGDTVVSGSRDRTIKIWDFKTGKNLDTLWGHNDEIRSVAISPDGKTIISGSRDRTIKIWDMNSGHVLRTLRGHSQSVTSIAVSADGNIIASGSRDSTIKIWDFNTGEFINTLLGHTDLVRSVAICNDGKTIISGSRDNTIKIWGSSY